MAKIMDAIEKQYRLTEASHLSGRSIHTLRRKIRLRELGYTRNGRIITIPASELSRLIGEYRPPINLEKQSA